MQLKYILMLIASKNVQLRNAHKVVRERIKLIVHCLFFFRKNNSIF